MEREIVKNIFERNGYSVFEYSGCFDVAGKRERIILVKLLKNIDSFLLNHAKSLKSMAWGLSADPLIVGNNTNYEKLQKGVVYERFGIPAVNIDTFEMIIEGDVELIWRDKGGKYVEIDPELLKKYRYESGLTQKQLAKLVGVSQKTIYIHENNTKRAPLELVEKIEEVLGNKIRKTTKMFVKYERYGAETEFEKFVERKFYSLGIETAFTRKTPMDMIGKEKELIVSAVEENKRKLKYKIGRFIEFLEFLDTDGAVITTFEADYSIPVISKDELEEIEDKKELFKRIRG